MDLLSAAYSDASTDSTPDSTPHPSPVVPSAPPPSDNGPIPSGPVALRGPPTRTLVTGTIQTIDLDESTFASLERRLAATGTTLDPSTGRVVKPVSVHAHDRTALPSPTLAKLKAGSSSRGGDPATHAASAASASPQNSNPRKRRRKEATPVTFIPSSQLHIPDTRTRDYQRRPWTTPPASARTFEQLETYTPFIPKRGTHTSHAHDKAASKVKFSPGYGHLLLSVGMDGTAKIWSSPLSDNNNNNSHTSTQPNNTAAVKQLSCLRSFVAHAKGIRDAAFDSGDGGLVDNGTTTSTSKLTFATAGWDEAVRVWDVESGRVVTNISGLGTVPLCVQFHPEAPNELLVGCTNRTVLQYDVRTASKAVQTYDQHMGAVNALCFVDDGRRFVSSADDKVLRMWEYGVPVVIRHVSDATSHSMPFLTLHPNGKLVACQSLDNQVRVFSVRGNKLRPHASGKKFSGHMCAGYACAVATSPDGRFVTSGDSLGRLFFWDWKSSRMFRTVQAHSGVCIGVDWHPTQPSLVASCGWDGCVKVWD